MQKPTTAANVADWLTRDRPPENIYDLLGVRLFDPDVPQLQQSIRSASRDLLAWQNHADPLKAQRAARLQHELGRASDVLASTEHLESHQQQLAAGLKSRYAASCGDDTTLWDADEVAEWLRTEGAVHESAIASVAERLILGSADLPDVILLDDEPEEISWTVDENVPAQRLIDKYVSDRRPSWRRRLDSVLFIAAPILVLAAFLAYMYVSSRTKYEGDGGDPPPLPRPAAGARQ